MNAIYIEAPDKSSGKRRQNIRISYDLVGFIPVEELRGASYIEARLETGRTHQIRVHMASLGHPVLGDPVYGPKRSPYPVTGGQLLHAAVIGFDHPATGERMRFEVPPEPRFLTWLERLKMR